MDSINVVVSGVRGRMGQEVLNAICKEPDLTLIAGSDILGGTPIDLPDGNGSIPVSIDLREILDDANVVVDFTNADGAMNSIRIASADKTNVVVGSTGLSQENYREASDLADANGTGIIIAPNFALGAVVMTHLLKEAARFFDFADLTEMHHEAKIDAPSGTAIAMAKAAVEGRGKPFIAPSAEKELVEGTRGGSFSGVTIHSARMPGRVAHHELVFGALGQTLTIRHDSINRESFMPGVMMAIRAVQDRQGLTVGLDKVIGL